MRADPVTSALRLAVFERDRGCIAPRLGAPDDCAGRLTLDHVKDQPRMGKRAPSDMAHLVSLCYYHHIESGWATSHRPELREYLRNVNASANAATLSKTDPTSRSGVDGGRA